MRIISPMLVVLCIGIIIGIIVWDYRLYFSLNQQKELKQLISDCEKEIIRTNNCELIAVPKQSEKKL